jgi:hypothetical protein
MLCASKIPKFDLKKEVNMRCIVFTNFRRQTENILVTPPQMVEQQLIWQRQLRPYCNCPEVDLIYIFIIDGYEKLVSGEVPFKALMIERAMRKVLETAARVEGLSDKIQIVGSEELIPTLANLQDIAENRGQPLNIFLLGGGKHPYYDSPKMIEAFIRLGRGFYIDEDEVILRFDEDVSVNQDSIEKLISFHSKLPYGRDKNEFRFSSGNYRIHHPEDILNDYAIRTPHFAPAGVGKLRPVDTNYEIAKHWINQIREIGADPYNQVISGAGLSMSLKSIRTLPPFANAGSPIVWIDDHLKRRLHEALGHLPPPPPINSKSKDESYRCCHQACFEQNRYPNGITQEGINWNKEYYLPRLVRGIIMDNLIWNHAKHRAGVYAGFVQEVINGGPVPAEDTLREALEVGASNTLDKVIKMWSDKRYKNFPIYDYAKNRLPQDKNDLLGQVVEAFHSYLKLLHAWQPFVLLWGFMHPSDPQNRWLYR